MAPQPNPQQPNAAQRRANLRLALILATIALAFGVGFVVKMSFFGGH